MDPRKCIFLVAGLLLLVISSPVDACKCLPPVLQNSYCDTNVVVLQAIFLEPSQKPGASPTDVVKGYKVQITKVPKGDQELKSKMFIDSMSATDCAYYHDPNGFNYEYLIAASYDNVHLTLSSCSYIERWSEMSSEQIQGVNGAYLEGCSCKIVPCYSQPCSSGQNTCILEQYEGGNAEYQIKKQVCVPKTDTECEWKNIVE